MKVQDFGLPTCYEEVSTNENEIAMNVLLFQRNPGYDMFDILVPKKLMNVPEINDYYVDAGFEIDERINCMEIGRPIFHW